MRVATTARFRPAFSALPLVLLAACNTSQPRPAPLGAATSAATLAGLFNTGVDASGAPLPAGAIDPHYVLTSNDPAFPGPNAYVATPAGSWVPSTATSKWISIQASNAGTAQRSYTYTTSFILSGVDPTSATLSGKWACEHSCVLRLNGTQVASKATPGWSSLTPFAVPAGSPFILGTNTLAFSVNNTSGGPTGIHVSDLTGTVGGCTADAQCPSATAHCDLATKTCEACLVDADCGGLTSGTVCAETTHTCVAGCRGASGNGCPSGDSCTSQDATIGQCVMAATTSSSATTSATTSSSATTSATTASSSSSTGSTSGATSSASTGAGGSSGTGGSRGTGGSAGLIAEGNGLLGCAVSARGSRPRDGSTGGAPPLVAALMIWVASNRRRRR